MESNGRSPSQKTANGRKLTNRPTRALSPLIGLLTMIAVTVVLAAILTVGVSALGTSGTPPTAGFDLSADAADSTIELEHAGGDAVDVRELSVAIEIDGGTLENQPPVPFVGAKGFDETPTGPFNARSDPIWRAGESARVDLASTNDPRLRAGATVTVTLVVDDHRIATLEATAR
ncbi:type IV pilin [Halostagnicola sp. A56]|uniref:type IV pilin n=1 Tax=Halostagnicola sp. A56 TaxID=1495067 RepID=UPI00049EAAD1|nr:type IV pilin N-terminal domain-containing protein [Halostagnicola sp. A56]